MFNLPTIPVFPKAQNSLEAGDFAAQYFLLRKKEQRIYTDAELARLPDVNKGHRYFNEWHIRKRSAERLIKLLKNKKSALQILEVGCGNGWLSAQLAAIENSEVTAMDINSIELIQAKRVFANVTNLNFIYGDIRDAVLAGKTFDVVVFAASIQYFPSLKLVLAAAFEQLSLQGEIHIIDSHFYQQNKVHEAKQRTRHYFEVLGFPSMAENYFHHSLNELADFNPAFIHSPASFANRFRKYKDPFYHVAIKNKYR